MDALKPSGSASFQPLKELENVDQNTFWNEIYPAGEAVILRGHCQDWDAVKKNALSNSDFSDYLLKLNPQGQVNTLIGRGDMDGRYFYNDDFQGFNFAPGAAPLIAFLGKLLDIEKKNEKISIYAGATPVDHLFPGLSDINHSDLAPTGTPPLIWIGNAARIAPHFDASDNIACCVRGPRTFLIFPPQQISNLYISPIDNTMAGQPASLVDPRNVDFDKFPKYRDAEKAARIALLNPGDAIFIPSLWWHYVESYEALSVLINYWWIDSNPGPGIASLAHAILNIRELPVNQRQAWRSFFDHYVFGPDAQSSVDHLPAHAKGVLGPPSPQRDHTIKNFLKSTLN